MYLAETGDPDILSLYVGSDIGEPRLEKVKSGLTVPTYVARTREAIRLSRGDVDPRFPEGLSKKVCILFQSCSLLSHRTPKTLKPFVFQGEIAHILCQAITQPDGELVAVLELIRKEDGMPFHEEDEEIACSYLVWGGIALHVCILFLKSYIRVCLMKSEVKIYRQITQCLIY